MIKLCVISICIFFIQWDSCISYGVSQGNVQLNPQNYSFSIDYENNQFLLDGQPFRFVSGSFHYFRTPKQFWRDRLRKMRLAGLNAVSTYVEWSLHEPERNQWNWEGEADLIEFIRIVQEEDLLLLLRPGPYICAERDFGGFPYWLLNVVPKGKLRTNDTTYMNYVEIYLSELFRRIQPYLRGNGGPIIMVQVENEYGSYKACDKSYLHKLTHIFKRFIGDNAVLYTTDGWYHSMLSCGSIPGVYATVDFGAKVEVREAFASMRLITPKGPLVNSEYYPGWLTHWNETFQTVPTDIVAAKLTEMLVLNASVNFYMFYGGTNFGFTSGANGGGPDSFLPQITSYDYDAPITEAGDITPKYIAIRNIIRYFLPLPNGTVPTNKSKGNYGRVKLYPVISLLGSEGRRLFGTAKIRAFIPPTMESMNLSSHLLLYETRLQYNGNNESELRSIVADRALVYIDRFLVGILSRSQKKYSLTANIARTSRLQILVENQGHLNYGNYISDYKGMQNTTFGNTTIYSWNCTGFRLQNISALNNVPSFSSFSGSLVSGPVFLRGYFNITGEPLDTYLDTTAWHKGVAYVNGHNLGRYWPSAGPQITLYVPSVFLRSGLNELVILEFEYIPDRSQMFLVDNPIFS